MLKAFLLIVIFHFFQGVVFPLTKKVCEKWIDSRFKNDK